MERAYAARMEQLTTSVYECTLPVEAHMICDLLSQAGIAARVDGEFLAGAGGELPLGNSIKVRVDPASVAEAREVIADWERQQPVEPASAVAPATRVRSPFWFFAGVMAGVALAFVGLGPNSQVDSLGLDANGDGRADVVYHFGSAGPGREPAHRAAGPLTLAEFDDDGDGSFDRRVEYAAGGAREL